MRVAGKSRELMTNGYREGLTAHYLSRELSCIEAPCQRAEVLSPVWKSCQARRPTREYKMVNGQNKWLGLECYQIAST